LYRNFKEFVPEQYKNSNRLESLMQIFIDRYLDQTRTLREIDTLTRLDTAQGDNLDDIGDIVGYERPTLREIGGSNDLFAFEAGPGLGYTSVIQPVVGGRWNSIKDDDGVALVGDIAYRYLLKMKVIRNNSRGTPDEIIQAVISISNTIPTLTEGEASIEVAIPGLNSGLIGLRDLYEIFLPRPIGVSMTIVEAPIGTTNYIGRYTGIASPRDITVAGANFDNGEHRFWIKAIDGTGPHEMIQSQIGYSKSFGASEENSKQRDSGLIGATGEVFTIYPDDKINKNGVEYEYIIFPMTRTEEKQSNRGLTVKYGLNDNSGVNDISYTGSGENEGQTIAWSANKFIMLAFIKNLDEDGGNIVFAPVFQDKTIDTATSEPMVQDDLNSPLLSQDGIIMRGAYNKAGIRYSMWLFSFSNITSKMIQIDGDGVADRVVVVGIDIAVVIYKRLDVQADWIIVTNNYTVGENTEFNNDEAIQTTNKIQIDGQTLILNSDIEVNEADGKYLAVILR